MIAISAILVLPPLVGKRTTALRSESNSPDSITFICEGQSSVTPRVNGLASRVKYRLQTSESRQRASSCTQVLRPTICGRTDSRPYAALACSGAPKPSNISLDSRSSPTASR